MDILYICFRVSGVLGLISLIISDCDYSDCYYYTRARRASNDMSVGGYTKHGRVYHITVTPVTVTPGPLVCAEIIRVIEGVMNFID